MQFARAVTFLRMAQNVEEQLQLPPVGIAHHRALTLRGGGVDQIERGRELCEAGAISAREHFLQPSRTGAQESRRARCARPGAAPLLGEQEGADVDATGAKFADQDFHFAPRQAA